MCLNEIESDAQNMKTIVGIQHNWQYVFDH